MDSHSSLSVMPRQARLNIPGIPLHPTHLGVNRCAIFLSDDNREHYLMLPAESVKQHEMAIHAYGSPGSETLSAEPGVTAEPGVRDII
jgi:hypothetical protein